MGRTFVNGRSPWFARPFPGTQPASCRLSVGLAGSGALAAALLLSGCQPQAAPPRPPLPVSTEAAATAPFDDSIDTVSTMEALGEVQLAARAGGRIQQLFVRQGDQVRKGQLLLVLDQKQQQADVARLEARMQTERLNYQRFQYLVRQGAAAAIDRDEKRQAYIAAREELSARRADLAFRDLRAPITGTVADLQVKLGDVISEGSPFTKIIRNDRLVARVDVPAVYSQRLRVGLPVILMDPATNRPMARSTVRSLDPTVVAGTQSLLAKAEFDNPDGVLRNGLRTRTRVVLDTRQQVAVPFAAVTQISGQSFVFRVGSLQELEVQPGRADLEALRRLPPGTTFALQTPVQLGPLQNDRYPVLKGLEAGTAVITSNLINLRHGLPVRAN